MMSVFAPWNEQKIVVTGATSGIGYAIVSELLERGATVFALGREVQKLEALSEKYPELLIVHQADLLNLKSTRGLMSRARDALGEVTGLVNSAGAINHEVFGNTGDDIWQKQLDLNLRVPTILLEESVKLMSSHGSAVMIGSTLGNCPIMTSTAYSAAKAGLEALVKVAARAGAQRGIRVNLVHPGVVETPMISEMRPDGQDAIERLQELAALHLLGRVGQPQELAEVVLDVLKWTFATGSIVTVDGGLTIQS